jgi:hypothetical protein
MPSMPDTLENLDPADYLKKAYVELSLKEGDCVTNDITILSHPAPPSKTLAC